MSGAVCPWCDKPTEFQGATCDLECYATWYAWTWDHADVVTITENRIIPLEEGALEPRDLTEQPWYDTMVFDNDQGGWLT
jgi:hypothetical protein